MSGYAFFQKNILLGVCLYFFSYIFDAIDGKLARLKKSQSLYGAWLDTVVDRLVFFSLIIGLANQIPSQYALIISCTLIFLFELGFESRYNIQAVTLKKLIKENKTQEILNWHASRDDAETTPKNKYEMWLDKNGLIKNPFSLVELLITLFIISPLLGLYFEFSLFAICILFFRILVQQKFWIDAR